MAVASAPWLKTVSAFPNGVQAQAACAIALALLAMAEMIVLFLCDADLFGCEFVIVTS
jgi:hypothetical protein